MRFDLILTRLAPDGDWNFETKTQIYMSRKPGDKKPVERTEKVRVYDDYSKIIWGLCLQTRP